MAEKARKKSSKKSAKAKKKSPAKKRPLKKKTKKTAKRKKKAKGFTAKVSGAFQAVVDTIKGTDTLRNKIEPKGTSETA